MTNRLRQIVCLLPQQTILLILMVFTTFAADATDKLSATIYHAGVLPQGIEALGQKSEVVLVNLTDLVTKEEELNKQLGSKLETVNENELAQMIAATDMDLLRQIDIAWQNQIKAREVGIADIKELPAVLFEWGNRQWLYHGNNAIDGYNRWLLNQE